MITNIKDFFYFKKTTEHFFNNLLDISRVTRIKHINQMNL